MRKTSLRVPITAALMAAISIVLGKFAAINLGDTIRISFENLPLILSSVILGPLWGLLSAVVADLLGCVLRGYAIIPMITAAQGLIGLLPGLLTRFVFRRTTGPTAAISTGIAHILGSMILKTFALHLAYGSPLPALFATRVPLYAAIGALEAYICAMLVRSGAIRREFAIPEGRRAKPKEGNQIDVPKNS